MGLTTRSRKVYSKDSKRVNKNRGLHYNFDFFLGSRLAKEGTRTKLRRPHGITNVMSNDLYRLLCHSLLIRVYFRVDSNVKGKQIGTLNGGKGTI